LDHEVTKSRSVDSRSAASPRNGAQLNLESFSDPEALLCRHRDAATRPVYRRFVLRDFVVKNLSRA